MVGGFERQHEQRVAAVVDAVDEAFAGVDQAQVGGIEPRLGDRADRPRAGQEVVEGERRAGAEGRAVLQAEPGLGDHAERALGADHQPVGAGAGAGAGQPPARHHARRGHAAEAFDEIVDMGVERREMAARAGRDPAADGRELEALRKMPQRQAVRLERALQRGTQHAALDPRRAARAVDLEQPVEPAQVEADRAGEALADRGLDAADHARAGAERDHRGSGLGGPLQHRTDVRFGPRLCNHIWRIVEVMREDAYRIRERLAVAVQQALVGIARADRRETCRRPQPRRAQRHVPDRRRRLPRQILETEVLPVERQQAPLLLDAQPVALEAPAPELPAPPAHRFVAPLLPLRHHSAAACRCLAEPRLC